MPSRITLGGNIFPRSWHICAREKTLAHGGYQENEPRPGKNTGGQRAADEGQGRIKVGGDADITIFHPATVKDSATYKKPNQTSEGIRYVLVNGVLVVSKGELINDANPGQPVRRPTAPR